MGWKENADRVIQQVHEQLPEDADLATRKRELRKVAGMYHGGTSWGRKVWSLRARHYLEQHGLPKRKPEDAKQPRLTDALERGDITFPFRRST